jgi:excisionase family DNA binding protein
VLEDRWFLSQTPDAEFSNETISQENNALIDASPRCPVQYTTGHPQTFPDLPVFTRVCPIIVNSSSTPLVRVSRKIKFISGNECCNSPRFKGQVMDDTLQGPKVLTPHEAADFFRVSTTTLRKMTEPRGSIPCVRVGPRGVRYTMAALQEWISEQQKKS